MNGTKFIKWSILIAVVAGIAGYVYHKRKKGQEKKLFSTARLERRDITQIINATGTIEAKGTLNIGSLITGVVEKLYVDQDQKVKKGQLLAKIDNGKGDTDVKRALGALQQAQADMNYQKGFYNRQKKLYDFGHISEDEFEQAQRSHDSARAVLAERTALHEKAVIDFENTKITSPIDGVIIKKHVSPRQGVANFSPPTILYTIAEDIRTMNVELEIDETDIGLVKVGQQAKLTFDTYQNRSFYGTINEISSAPMTTSGAAVIYKATIEVDNKHTLLKPGMTVHARIVIGEKENIFALPGNLFKLRKKTLKYIAKIKKYKFKPLSKIERDRFRALPQRKTGIIKSIWVLEKNAFVQKPIELGITDNAFFEIIAGISGNEDVIVDIVEPDAMKELYKQFFGGGLTSKKS